MYEYAARLDKVVDGDTIDLDVDLGFGVWMRQRIRLAGLNCPEHGSPEGDAATAYTASWLDQRASQLVLRTQRDHREKYGRYLGTVLAGSESLNDALITSGHAVPYDGGRRTVSAGQSDGSLLPGSAAGLV